MIKVDVKGVEETKKHLTSIAGKIEKGTQDTIKQVGELGWRYAQNLAPEYTGATKAALINFPDGKNAWIILSQKAPSDAVPVNVWFDEGTYQKPRRADSLLFMQQTKAFLEKEFAERLNLSIQRSLK